MQNESVQVHNALTPWETIERLMNKQYRKWGYLAGPLGLTTKTIGNWRKDNHEPTDSQKALIAEALDVAVADIWPEEAA